MQKGRTGKLSPPAAFLITLIVCLLAYLFAALAVNSGSGGSGSVSKVNVSSIRQVSVLQDGLVYYNGNSIGFVQSNGHVRWTYMAGGDARFEATENGVAVWRGRTLTLLNIKDGSIYYSVAQSDDIIAVNIGTKYVSIVYGDAHNSRVQLLDSEGHFVKTLSFDSQLVLKSGFYSGGSYFWTLSLETDGTVVGSTVSTYKPASQLVSGSINDQSQINYDCLFLDDRILCIGEKYIKTYAYTGIEDTSRRSLVYGWYMKAIDLSPDPLMVFTDDASYSGQKKIQDIMLVRADDRQHIRFPFGCDSVCASEGVAYGFSIDDRCVMSASIGRGDVTRKQFGLQFDSVYGVMNGKVAAVGVNGVLYLLDLN